MSTNTLSEQDVIGYLHDHPDFFASHPELLAGLQLPHPTNGAAISLVERQSLVLRERIKSLEARLAELIRHGQENDAIADQLTDWSRRLLAHQGTAEMPEVVVEELKQVFNVPYGAVRLWGVASEHAHLPAASPAGADAAALAHSMQSPYCGANVGFEAASWLNHDPSQVQSMVMLPLRVPGETQTFGLVVLGSPDKDRFHITMGTAFLRRMTELASAALVRLTR